MHPWDPLQALSSSAAMTFDSGAGNVCRHADLHKARLAHGAPCLSFFVQAACMLPSGLVLHAQPSITS